MRREDLRLRSAVTIIDLQRLLARPDLRHALSRVEHRDLAVRLRARAELAAVEGEDRELLRRLGWRPSEQPRGVGR